MFKIIYKTKSEHKLKSFIVSYKNVFLRTFVDTGLFYEDIIRQNYINNSEKFYNEIIDNIDQLLIGKNIFGYKILDNNNLQTITKVGNFRLFIEFTENFKEKIRYVEDIDIYSK